MLHFKLKELLVKNGFTSFTKIQEAAIPRIVTGKDVLVIAPTGFGKTETAFLPVLSNVLKLKDASSQELRGIQVVYITPLKALNRDITERLTSWCESVGVTISVRHGDTTQAQREKQKENPPNVLVTTPETLASVLVAPILCDSLVNVKHVIVDELHELFGSKRGTSLTLNLERLEEKASGFQRIGLSATIGNETDAALFLGKDVEICKIDLKREIELNVKIPTEAPQEIKKLIKTSGESASRVYEIENAIHAHKSTLIFTNTRYVAESLSTFLTSLESLRGKFAVHHSSLSKETRLDTEKEFKDVNGNLRAVICTSSLELGIDIGKIDHVIQYGSPRQVSRLLQRVGRSGHKYNLKAKGTILPLDEVDLIEAVVICNRAAQGKLEEIKMQNKPFDALANFIAGLTLDFHTITLQKALSIALRAQPYKKLENRELLLVVRQLSGSKIIDLKEEKKFKVKQAEDEAVVGTEVDFEKSTITTRGVRTRLYYYENVSMIPTEKKFFVKNAITRKNVSVLDEGFVAEYVKDGAVFISAGKPWRVNGIDEEKNEITVEPAGDFTAAVPDWLGEEIPVTFDVAQDVFNIMKHHASLSDKYTQYISKHEENILKNFCEKQMKIFTPNASEMVIESKDDACVIHSPFGLKVNETLARVLGLLLAHTDKALRVRAQSYAITLIFSSEVKASEIERIVKSLEPAKLEYLIETAVLDTPAFRRRFIHVGKRFGFLSKTWDGKGVNLKRIIAKLPKDSPIVTEALKEVYSTLLDVEKTIEVTRAIKTRDIYVKSIQHLQEKFSPLAKNSLDLGGLGELFAPSEPVEAILSSFIETVKDKNPRLICTHCKNATTLALRALKLNDKVACSHCGSTQVASEQYEEAILKSKQGKKLSKELQNRLEDAQSAMSLISSYGARALFALETYGVGPATASRLLARLHTTEDSLFTDLLEAQKTFLKNRKYWKL